MCVRKTVFDEAQMTVITEELLLLNSFIEGRHERIDQAHQGRIAVSGGAKPAVRTQMHALVQTLLSGLSAARAALRGLELFGVRNVPFRTSLDHFVR
jgi:hypothetical protein